MTSQLRTGIVAGKPEVTLSGKWSVTRYMRQDIKATRSCEKKKRSSGAAKPSQRGSGRAPLKEKPRFGMIQRRGEVIVMLSNVQQTTIAPLIKATIVLGSLIYTMSTPSTLLYQSGAMNTKQCVMVEAVCA